MAPMSWVDTGGGAMVLVVPPSPTKSLLFVIFSPDSISDNFDKLKPPMVSSLFTPGRRDLF